MHTSVCSCVCVCVWLSFTSFLYVLCLINTFGISASSLCYLSTWSWVSYSPSTTTSISSSFSLMTATSSRLFVMLMWSAFVLHNCKLNGRYHSHSYVYVHPDILTHAYIDLLTYTINVYGVILSCLLLWIVFVIAGGVGLMGYSWSRGLRQTATAELSWHWCYTYVFLSGFTRFTRKYSRKMDARGKVRYHFQ